MSKLGYLINDLLKTPGRKTVLQRGLALAYYGVETDGRRRLNCCRWSGNPNTPLYPSPEEITILKEEIRNLGFTQITEVKREVELITNQNSGRVNVFGCVTLFFSIPHQAELIPVKAPVYG
jgi:hypothetical protein